MKGKKIIDKSDERDEYGHYVNNESVEINASTDKSGRDHIDLYDSCPAKNPNLGSIHINFNSETGTGTIVDTTSGDKETTDVGCYLTTACMRNKANEFDDNCEELTILRWFRDKFVAKEDIEHYYETAPIIVSAINEKTDNNKVYDYIYRNIICVCIDAIKNGDYEFAYKRYKSGVLSLEEAYVKPKLAERLSKVLKKYKATKQ